MRNDPKSHLEMVVARYAESLDWIPAELRPLSCVYNKGCTLETTNEYKQYQELPNVGRESHTYLTYILERYDSLPPIVVFTQGNPFDHSRDFVERVSTLPADTTFVDLGHLLIEIKYMFPCNHPAIHSDLLAYYQAWVGEPLPVSFVFSAGGIFAVSRDKITSRPREYYQELIKALSTEVDPVAGYCFERLWRFIFNSHL